MDNEIKIQNETNLSNYKATKSNQRKLIYLLIFLFTLHFTPATYIESTFIESLVGAEGTGLIYSLASAITIVAIILARKIIRLKGNFKTFVSVLFIELISLGILALSNLTDKSQTATVLLITAFIVGFIARSIAFLNFDIFLERLSKDSDTGSIRGGFLTSLNFAFVIGPILGGMIAKDIIDISKVFLLGVLILLPVIYITLVYFRNFKESNYQHYHFWETIKYIIRHSDLRLIFICNFLLFFFYSWMIIYTPIFLNKIIGFSFTEVGIIIGIALLPFIFLQYILGRLADKKYGEKEILTIGFIIAGLATILMSVLNIKIFVLWAIILFITRIGASMIESMVETYLFKKINSKDVDIIGAFRSTRPIAYIVAPLVASFILIFFPISMLFLILGLILIFGTYFSTRINDTL